MYNIVRIVPQPTTLSSPICDILLQYFFCIFLRTLVFHVAPISNKTEYKVVHTWWQPAIKLFNLVQNNISHDALRISLVRIPSVRQMILETARRGP